MKAVKSFITIISFAGLLLSSCATTTAGPQTWIDKPLDNTTVPLAPVSIMAHASDNDGVASIEFFVNGESQGSVIPVPNAGARLGRAEMEFNPGGPGVYRIDVSAVDTAGNAGSIATVNVIVHGDVVAPPPTEKPATEAPTDPSNTQAPPTEAPQAEPPPSGEVTVSFYADPSNVNAGGCSTLHWDIEGTETVYWNGAPVYYRGMEERCNLCNNETHKLQVVKPDGSTQDYWVTITVSGSCSAPVTDPPPADVIIPDPVQVDEDNTPPTISNTSIEPSVIYPSVCGNSFDKIARLTVTATDDVDEVLSVKATWFLGSNFDVVTLNYVGANRYQGNFGPYDSTGTLKIIGSVTDAATNWTPINTSVQVKSCIN